MGILVGGWRRAVAFRRSTGDKVQFNLLSTEYSSLQPDNIKKQTPTGQAFGGKIYPFALGFLEPDGLDQLNSWMESNTPLGVAVFSKWGAHYITLQDEEIQVVPGVGIDGREGAEVHRIEQEIVGGNTDVIHKQNIAEGITFSEKIGEIILPISGITWTVAADYTSSVGDLVVNCLDFEDNVVATALEPLEAGRISTQITTTADTWKIVIDLVNGGTSAVSNISVRSDGKTEYVNY